MLQGPLPRRRFFSPVLQGPRAADAKAGKVKTMDAMRLITIDAEGAVQVANIDPELLFRQAQEAF